MSAPTTVVSMSHDGTTWVDVSGSVAAGSGLGVSFSRGRSRTLEAWQPGTISARFRNQTRTVDPCNDDATFQPRPGDSVKVVVKGADAWHGYIDDIGAGYRPGGSVPDSMLDVSGSDELARLNNQKVPPATFLLLDPAYGGQRITDLLALYGSTVATDLDTGDVALPAANFTGGVISWDAPLPDVRGQSTALPLLQQTVATEGGASALFVNKAGELAFRSRYHQPSTVVALSASAIPFHDIAVDMTSDEWRNEWSVTAVEYSYFVDSATSMAPATGTKNFTLSGTPFDDVIVVGLNVYAVSSGSTGNNMTGTVTGYNSGTNVLTVDVTSKNGSTTRTDWELTLSPGATEKWYTDAESVARYQRTIAGSSSDLLLVSNTEAEHRAIEMAASQAHPSRRITAVAVELAALTGAQQDTILGLEIGDALDVTFDLGTGDPQVIRETRLISGITHSIPGNGSHVVRFALGRQATVAWTPTLKQNGTTVASTNHRAVYTMEDGWVVGRCYVEATAAGTVGTAITVAASGLPTPATYATRSVGIGRLAVTLTTYVGVVHYDGTEFSLVTDNNTGVVGVAPSLTLASGNDLSFSFRYKAA